MSPTSLPLGFSSIDMLFLQALPNVQDKTRDVAVEFMIETAFESYSRCPLGGCSSGISASIDASANRSGRSGMNSDAIVVMSMLATDALIQVLSPSLAHTIPYTGSHVEQECRAAAAEGVAIFNDVITAYNNHVIRSVTSEVALPASSNSITHSSHPDTTIAPVMSLDNLLSSPLPPRSLHLMHHCGAALAASTAAAAPHDLSARLLCVSHCLQACNSWSLRDCRFHVALRMTRLCKVAMGDMFSACSRQNEGVTVLKAVAAEWRRRLRVEVGVAMGNVHACQFFQENRTICKCIDSFQPSRAPAARMMVERAAAAHVMSPVNSDRIREVTRGSSPAAAVASCSFEHGRLSQ